MLLAIDIGNTNVVLALFSEDRLIESWRLHTNRTHTADDWWITVEHLADQAQVEMKQIKHVIISSVLPVVGRAMTQMSQRYLDLTPLRVSAQLPLDLNLDVSFPATVGSDRICNVVAAKELYGAPCVIVDLGTATTFDVISETGHFIGGAIAPGIITSAQQLFADAALLSAVELRVPEQAIGRDTETNLLSGIVFGAVDLIDGMLVRIREERGWAQFPVVVTGGLGELIAEQLRTPATYDPNLTVNGLRLIHARCG